MAHVSLSVSRANFALRGGVFGVVRIGIRHVFGGAVFLEVRDGEKMSNPRQAALDELRNAEKAADEFEPLLTMQALGAIKAIMQKQNRALRRVLEYSDAVALET